MSHDQRTPVVPARRLTADSAQVGDRIAVTLDEGTYPFEIATTHQITTDDDQSTVLLRLHEISTRTDITPREVEVILEATTPLAALATHFGTCHECGRLSPCPDELAERRLEALWRDDDPHPDTAPPASSHDTTPAHDTITDCTTTPEPGADDEPPGTTLPSPKALAAARPVVARRAPGVSRAAGIAHLS